MSLGKVTHSISRTNNISRTLLAESLLETFHASVRQGEEGELTQPRLPSLWGYMLTCRSWHLRKRGAMGSRAAK